MDSFQDGVSRLDDNITCMSNYINTLYQKLTLFKAQMWLYDMNRQVIVSQYDVVLDEVAGGGGECSIPVVVSGGSRQPILTGFWVRKPWTKNVILAHIHSNLDILSEVPETCCDPDPPFHICF